MSSRSKKWFKQRNPYYDTIDNQNKTFLVVFYCAVCSVQKTRKNGCFHSEQKSPIKSKKLWKNGEESPHPCKSWEYFEMFRPATLSTFPALLFSQLGWKSTWELRLLLREKTTSRNLRLQTSFFQKISSFANFLLIIWYLSTVPTNFGLKMQIPFNLTSFWTVFNRKKNSNIYKKIVKVCWHSSLKVQNPLQFDDFFTQNLQRIKWPKSI